jgi:hypothetical protein
VVAPLVIGLELVIGLSLLIGVGVQLTTVTAALLFSGFIMAILINLVRHNILDCNCFGPYFFKEKISIRATLRNLVLVILCLWVWRFYDGYLALESRVFVRTVPQNYSLEQFFLLTATIVVAGIGIMAARMVLKNSKLVKSDSSS